MDIRSLLIVLLVVVCVAAAFYAFVIPLVTGDAQAEKRQDLIMGKGSVAKGRSEGRVVDAAARRKAVADSLKELDERNKAKKRITLEMRIAQAGLNFTRFNFMIGSAVAGVVVALLLYGASGSTWMAVAGLPIGGLGMPNFWLNFMIQRRLKKFALEFPAAIDIIIRGVKAGLPIGDCLRIIATESSEPVRSEFRQVVEAQALGLGVTEAIEHMPERIPTPEANFFAIVIAIQQKSGGNLAEALSNLARVLRERKKMRDKIKAVSSEAKASAGIIGSLPVVVALLVYITSPHYIEILWIHDTGKIVLVVCALVMAFGIFVMKKMISFDI